MQFIRAVNHSIVHAQPLQIPDHSSDESDPADNDVTDDADTDQATPSPADGVESVPAPLQTPVIRVKAACCNHLKVWLWCRVDIRGSVAVALILSHR